VRPKKADIRICKIIREQIKIKIENADQDKSAISNKIRLFVEGPREKIHQNR
jgi:hypothetical protein